MWGRGFVCVFPEDLQPTWVPERLVKHGPQEAHPTLEENASDRVSVSQGPLECRHHLARFPAHLDQSSQHGGSRDSLPLIDQIG